MQDHSPPGPEPIPFPKFIHATAAAALRFSRIKEKFSHLRAYLVVSLPTGQAPVENSYAEMFKEFPELLIDTPAKTKALTLAREILRLNKEKDGMALSLRAQVNDQIAILNDRLLTISHELIVNGNCRFEIRFHHLDYALIHLLQSDELIDQNLTPQTRASIRIGLGTVSHFSLS